MDIEEIGASYLRKVISYSSYLKASILTKDRIPSWDGEIFAYKSPECKKEDLYGKAPIQVKTKQVKKFSSNFRTFSIDVKDLKNYFNDGGCIFFVIETKDRKEIIFVRDLLPSDIKELLTIAKESSQKSISVSLKRLDITSSIELENLCKSFILNRSIQFSTKDCPPLRHEDAIKKIFIYLQRVFKLKTTYLLMKSLYMGEEFQKRLNDSFQELKSIHWNIRLMKKLQLIINLFMKTMG